jgi:hypothetical protein
MLLNVRLNLRKSLAIPQLPYDSEILKEIENIFPHKNLYMSQTLVAHSCNCSYSGGKDQEDLDLKLALSKQFTKPVFQSGPRGKVPA